MTGQRPAGDTGPAGQTEEERRRRRARVFGDVLPDATRDERGPEGGGGRGDGDGAEDWLLREVPPHHG